MNMPARAPVMPLAQTREEINATAAALRHLAAIWGECFSSVQLDKRAVERVCIVGSGDSWTVALCAAAWLGKYTHLFCSALQTWDFLQTDLTRYQKETLIIILSASGRPSLTVDALSHAVCSNAQVLGVTNCPGTPFCAITENMLYTWANKQGIPTQSSSVTLYTLLRLAQNLCPGLTPLQIEEDLEGKFSQINQHWQQKKRHFYQQKEITFLGSGLSWGLAISGSNLLSCGPQIRATAFPLEEFYHSLRLHQAGVGQHYFLLPATSREYPFYIATQKAIVGQGATAELISFIPDASESNNLFLVMQWLYEMCWHLSCDYVDAGGQRVSHREK
ncbi:TPA: SIS domain-containing protein [Escherichia coli]|nr:SIS domain-containing protein [Escherichia coli]